MRKGHRWLAAATLEVHNRPLRPIRARIEKIFGTWKRSYRFRAMRWLGLAKAKCQVHLAAIAYSIKRFWLLQTARMDRAWAISRRMSLISRPPAGKVLACAAIASLTSDFGPLGSQIGVPFSGEAQTRASEQKTHHRAQVSKHFGTIGADQLFVPTA
jgi:hypothetical protein